MGVYEDITENFSKFFRDANEFGREISLKPFNYIFIAGMGASALPGDVVKVLKKDVPVETVRSYSLPKYANEESLVLVVSYSGNTEETLQMYNEALRKKCQIIAITSGGKLSQKCLSDSIPYIKIPSGIQPRASLPYLLVPILNLLNYDMQLDSLYAQIENSILKGKAKELAEKLQGKIPLIYSSIPPVSYRWKTQLNENAKIHTFANAFPELNHNEIEGFENLNGEYYAVFISDEGDIVRIKKRMQLTKEIIKEKGIDVTEIAMKGRNEFHRLMIEMYAGSLTSVYLAELNGTDPTQIDLIENFKKRL